jgi:Protein of unknown function (DUF2637)
VNAWRAAPAAGRGIRALTAVVVIAVAAFAFTVSYSHIYDLGRAHGQAGTAARLLPLSVDGLILAAGLVLLHAARNGQRAPVLAQCMLALGVLATVGANVSYGLPYGPLGALVSAWPAVAFTGSAEMALGMARLARRAPEAVPAAPGAAPAEAATAAAEFTADLAAGKLPGIRAIRGRLHVGQDKATQVQAYLRTRLAGTAYPGGL